MLLVLGLGFHWPRTPPLLVDDRLNVAPTIMRKTIRQRASSTTTYPFFVEWFARPVDVRRFEVLGLYMQQYEPLLSSSTGPYLWRIGLTRGQRLHLYTGNREK